MIEKKRHLNMNKADQIDKCTAMHHGIMFWDDYKCKTIIQNRLMLDVYNSIDKIVGLILRYGRDILTVYTQCHSGIPKRINNWAKSIENLSIIIRFQKPTKDLWTIWNVCMHDGQRMRKRTKIKCQNRSGTPMRTDWWRD